MNLKSVATLDYSAMSFRWLDSGGEKRLQMLWFVYELDGPTIVKLREEWRDVPTVVE